MDYKTEICLHITNPIAYAGKCPIRVMRSIKDVYSILGPEKEIHVKNSDDSWEGHANGGNVPLNRVHLKVYLRHCMHHRNSMKSFKNLLSVVSL